MAIALGSIARRVGLIAGTLGLVAGVGIAGATPRVAAELTGSPLVFGVVGAPAGPEGSSSWGQAMEAYVKYWNSQGGYKGHRIELDVVNAAEDPSDAADAARQLVSVDNVLALVANFNVIDCFVNTGYYASIPIAVVNAQASSACTFDRKVDFELINPDGTINLSVLVKWAHSHGVTKFGTLNPQIPELAHETAQLSAYAKKLSHKSVVNTTVPITATAADYDGAIVQMKAQGVKAVLGLEITPLVIQEANRQGFGPANGIKWFTLGFSSATPAATLPGVYAVSSYYPFGTNYPGIKAATKILKAGNVSPLDVTAASGYQGIIQLRSALNLVKGPVTRASLLEALGRQKNFQVPLTPLIAHPSNPVTNPEGGFVYEAKGNNWVQVSQFITVLKP